MRKVAAIAMRLILLGPLTAAAADPPASSVLLSPTLWSDLGIDAPLETPCRSLACDRGLSSSRLQFGQARGLSATLVEFPSYEMPGRPARAQHGIGIRSYRMEAALNEIGIGARHCLAPVVRMHTKLSAGFDLSGTLWVYVRCSFE